MAAILSLILSIASSRIGQIAVAALVAAIWSWSATSKHCRQEIAAITAARDAANAAELVRQEEAARELAAEATKRLVAEQEQVKENDVIIDELRKAESDAKPQQTILYRGRKVYISDRPCSLDNDFLDRLHKLRP